MILSSLYLQCFRSYTQRKFDFSPTTTIIIGPNTAGKTNLGEAVALLSSGKSFKGATDESLIHFGKDIGRIKALVLDVHTEKTTLEVVLVSSQYNGGRFGRKFLVNDVAKSRKNFVTHLPLVLFRPEELDIVIAGPSLRRNFLDDVLEQVDSAYATHMLSYTRALKQRNALLRRVKETGQKSNEQFSYWDNLLITHGQYIAQSRAQFLQWVGEQQKDVIDFTVVYDDSKISRERLDKYQDAEIGAGVTLVGPHRDDFLVFLDAIDSMPRDAKIYGSRGQQRLVVLQLKLLQIAYIAEKLGQKPLLFLDDIFSELDSGHIALVLQKINGIQTIMTTTHKEFIPQDLLKKYSVIELHK